MAKVRGDKVIAYTFSDPRYRKAHIDAPAPSSAAMANGTGLSYSCTTSADHVTVTSFNFKIGSRVPREEWSSISFMIRAGSAGRGASCGHAASVA